MRRLRQNPTLKPQTATVAIQARHVSLVYPILPHTPWLQASTRQPWPLPFCPFFVFARLLAAGTSTVAGRCTQLHLLSSPPQLFIPKSTLATTASISRPTRQPAWLLPAEQSPASPRLLFLFPQTSTAPGHPRVGARFQRAEYITPAGPTATYRPTVLVFGCVAAQTKSHAVLLPSGVAVCCHQYTSPANLNQRSGIWYQSTFHRQTRRGRCLPFARLDWRFSRRWPLDRRLPPSSALLGWLHPVPDDDSGYNGAGPFELVPNKHQSHKRL